MTGIGMNDRSFEEALLARRAVLAKEYAEASARLEELQGAVAGLEADLGHIDALLGEAGSAAGGASHGAEAAAPAGASGERPTADLVVALLDEIGRPLHYREIARELEARGVTAEGKDPANTLLSRYFDDPRLYRPKRGTYALRNGLAVRSVGGRRTRKGT